MNQILSTKLKENQTFSEKKNWFKFQFTFSIIIILLSIFCTGYYFYHLQKEEDFSNHLLDNYNIYRLYSNPENSLNEEASNGLFGIIEIPKINLYYPVFSHLTEDLLKISPCKFYGDTPNTNGNICIAGHNYDNSLFFSKLSNLSIEDQISIYDSNGTHYIYSIYDIYEVSESDLSPILNYEKEEKILTLVTCNNFNANRIIIRAKQKKLF